MELLTLEQVKEAELRILVELDQVCNDNKLTYFLAYGTLLGAIRHGGFIPWDDDIDVWMPRDDYECLKSVLSRKTGRYQLLYPEQKESSHYSFYKYIDSWTKVVIENEIPVESLGVWIDIFPLDNYRDNTFWQNKIRMLKTIYFEIVHQKQIYTNNPINKIIKTILRVLFGRVDASRISILLDKTVQKYNKTDTAFNQAFLDELGKKEVFSKEWFADSVQVNFEGRQFAAPVGYEHILRQLYGDYLKLPPIDKRNPSHGFEACWRKTDEV